MDENSRATFYWTMIRRDGEMGMNDRGELAQAIFGDYLAELPEEMRLAHCRCILSSALRMAEVISIVNKEYAH